MSKSFSAFGFAVGAVALTCLPAAAQTKVTDQGISASEIVIGTHQDLSGPIKVWGVPVSNGMKMAVEEINAAGGINGRKIKMVLEDSFFFQAEDGIRAFHVTGVQTCALPIYFMA